jgi:predicted ATPase/class 3 adenylate cyclase
VADGAKFCLECGTDLGGGAVRCAACGAPLGATARFCPQCGEPGTPREVAEPVQAPTPGFLQRHMPRQYVEHLLASKGRPAGERRVITILFLDVEGSTAMEERLDPEDVMEIMNGAFAALLEPIYRWEGTLARLMGDGILCFFGAPITHEDDPVRACRCALDLLDAARAYAERIERERGLHGFAVRVGVHTGLVVVGEVGDDLRVEYTAMGDAVNLAARLQSMAERGSVLISEHTHRLLHGRFETDALGLVTVRGRSQPVRVHRLRGLKSRPGNLGAGTAIGAPLVGRTMELERLSCAVQCLERGRGAVIMLTGEPGVGKTRLIEEVRARAEGAATWFETRCMAHARGTSYGATQALLAALFSLSPDTPPAALVETARAALHRDCDHEPGCAGAENIDRTLGWLAHMLEVPVHRRHDPAPPDDPEIIHRNLQQAFRDLLSMLAGRQPMVLVWEDLHWADLSSLDMLEHAAALCDRRPILFLLTLRSGEEHTEALHERLLAGPGVRQRVELQALGNDDCGRLAAGLLCLDTAPEPSVLEVLKPAEGNPFYIEEILRSLQDAGLVSESGGRTRLDRDATTLLVPDSIQGVIMARMDRLRVADRRVLQTAAVIGRTFSSEMLLRLCEPALDRSELESALRSLEQRAFITTSSPHGDYAFRHALTADVAYNALLLSERRAAHGRLAQLLEQRAEHGVSESLLAYHYSRAAMREEAFVHALRAAAEAGQVFANREAIAHYRLALRLASESSHRSDAAWVPVGRDLTALHEKLGDVHYLVSDYAEAVERYRAALPLVETRLPRAVLLRKLGQALEKWGRFEEAHEQFEAAMQQMGGDMDPAEAARIFIGLGGLHSRRKESEPAAQLCQLALELFEKLEDRRGISQACSRLGIIHGQQGDWRRAVEHHRRCLAICEELKEPYGLAVAHHNLGRSLAKQGEHAEGVSHLEQSVELFRNVGNELGLARAYDSLSLVHLEMGDLEPSREYQERAVSILADLSVDESGADGRVWQSGAW